MIHTPLPAGTEVSWTVPTLHGAKTYSGCVLAFITATDAQILACATALGLS